MARYLGHQAQRTEHGNNRSSSSDLDQVDLH